VAFIAGSSDLLFADAEGMIYRLRSNLEMQRLGVVPGVKALAGDRVRALAIAGAKIDALPFDGAEAISIDCPVTQRSPSRLAHPSSS
jgi:hypothetical protein